MENCNKPDNCSVRCSALSLQHLDAEDQLFPAAEDMVPASASLDARFLAVLCDLARNVKRIADALDPAPPDIVGTPYVAKSLSVTTTWIADLIRRGEIPHNCIVPGTGNGKPWKFYRERIDRWIATR
jgi:hypothetical protein